MPIDAAEGGRNPAGPSSNFGILINLQKSIIYDKPVMEPIYLIAAHWDLRQ
jgi:hypothetical protein